MRKPVRRLGRPPGESKTRERILEAALELFAARGFAGTSIRRIARAVGITEGGLYAHFPSKQAVFETLFREAGPAVVTAAVLAHEVERGQGPEVFVRALIRDVLAAWAEPRARKFAGVALREGTLGTAEGAPSLTAGIAEALREVGAALRPWAAAGLIRSDFPPEHLAWELFAPLVNLRFMFLHPNAAETEIAAAQAFGARHADYFLSCVLTERSKAHGEQS